MPWASAAASSTAQYKSVLYLAVNLSICLSVKPLSCMIFINLVSSIFYLNITRTSLNRIQLTLYRCVKTTHNINFSDFLFCGSRRAKYARIRLNDSVFIETTNNDVNSATLKQRPNWLNGKKENICRQKKRDRQIARPDINK